MFNEHSAVLFMHHSFLAFTWSLQQCNDVSLMTYLGMLTKGCNDINQVNPILIRSEILSLFSAKKEKKKKKKHSASHWSDP